MDQIKQNSRKKKQKRNAIIGLGYWLGFFMGVGVGMAPSLRIWIGLSIITAVVHAIWYYFFVLNENEVETDLPTIEDMVDTV